MLFRLAELGAPPPASSRRSRILPKPRCSAPPPPHLGLLLAQAHQQVPHRLVPLRLRLRLPLRPRLCQPPLQLLRRGAARAACSPRAAARSPLLRQLTLQLLQPLLQAAGVHVQGAVGGRQVLKVGLQLAGRSLRRLRVAACPLCRRRRLCQLLLRRLQLLPQRSRRAVLGAGGAGGGRGLGAQPLVQQRLLRPQLLVLPAAGRGDGGSG